MRRLLGLMLGLALAGPIVTPADGVHPVTLQVREKEPGRFLAQWRVPKQLPARAAPAPVLPESCAGIGERAVAERAGAWLLQQLYECPGGLSGQTVGIDYPFLNVTVSTLVRVEMLSGERHGHMLAPGEDSWRIPAAPAGGAPALLRIARDAVLDGARHFAGNPVHLFFLLALVLLGAFGNALRLATFFTLGQLAAVALVAFSGLRLGPAYAEIGVAVAAALLAREALRPAADRRQLVALAAAAGLVHGLGVAGMVSPSHEGSIFLYGSLAVLGLDATLLLSIIATSLVGRLALRRLSRAPFPATAAYLTAGLALALALSAPVPDGRAAAAESRDGLELPSLTVPAASGSPASRRLGAQVPDAPLQSFVSIDAFEVRHEVLVRLAAVADRVGLDPASVLAVEQQEAVKERVRDLVTPRTRVNLDGKVAEAIGRRVDFLTLDARGARLRPSAVPEPVEAAWIGVTAVYLTAATPREVALAWEGFEAAPIIPATVTDPESSRSVRLTAAQPVLRWTNELAQDPAPVVRSTAVDPATLWIPLLSLLLLGVMVLFVLAAARGLQRDLFLGLARVTLAGAVLLSPVGGVASALPLSTGSVPTPAGARRILAGVLPNLYRAFEFPRETAAYNRLALSVTGETLTEIYLEHRRAVEMEERGGARARVESVEVVEVGSVTSGSPEGFTADATWTVGGTVTHFGHRHFRQNRYDARVTLVPVEGSWKIRSIEVLEEKRVR